LIRHGLNFGVCHFARIMLREPGIKVVGDAYVEMLVREALKDVDIFHRRPPWPSPGATTFARNHGAAVN
jgi:hypothetical protein